MPTLKANAAKPDSIQIGKNNPFLDDGEMGEAGETGGTRGKWEDEEERRFYEDIPDLKDYVPRGVLGIEDDLLNGNGRGKDQDSLDGVKEKEERERREREFVEEEVRKLDEELAGLDETPEGDVEIKEAGNLDNGETFDSTLDEVFDDDEDK